MTALIAAVAAGLLATATMDAGNGLLVRAGLVPPIDHVMIGRVLRSWLRGRWIHPSPASVPAFPRERSFGYLAHYGIGVAFAIPFATLGRPLGGAAAPLAAIAYGVATTAAAYLLLFPSMGLGLCGLRSSTGWRLPLSSLVNHAIYGGGLALGLTIFAGATRADAAAITPMPPVVDADYHRDGRFPKAQVELGRLLFFDKVLSGNRNIACATCHHPRHATSDGLSLPLGEGGAGLGPERRLPGPEHAVLDRVPRHSQALFNVGAREYTSMFADGRVEDDPEGSFAGGFRTPAREDLPEGLGNVLAAQAMFPVTSAVEMSGAKGENQVATAAALDRLHGPNGVWELLAGRLREIAEYVDLFRAAFPRQVRDGGDITFVLAANAIAAFETVAFRSDGSPFDAYLRSGDPSVLGEAAERGWRLFYGRARCAECHSGRFQSDQRFHAIAVPQIGPGKGDGFDDRYWSRTGTVARVEDYG
ncbi:MAG TPA: DUF2938 family protein, partial [bacterium]|nr:DUF2938 family protein [bacterium]